MPIGFNEKTKKHFYKEKEATNICENCIYPCKKNKQLSSCIHRKTQLDIYKESEQKSKKGMIRALKEEICSE